MTSTTIEIMETGKIISINSPFVGPDGTKHPRGWLARRSDAELLEMGLRKVSPPSSPPESESLANWRTTATLTRAQFCMAVKRAGILPDDEAIDAAKGNWPATFTSALSGLPVDQVEAEIVWASVALIPRTDPVLEAIRVYAGMTDEDVDAMFGWEA